jgi:hypothetical protein
VFSWHVPCGIGQREMSKGGCDEKHQKRKGCDRLDSVVGPRYSDTDIIDSIYGAWMYMIAA